MLERSLPVALSWTLAVGGLAAVGTVTIAPAHAAPDSTTDAVFTWDINDEVNAGAFAPGTWNLMSAGIVGDPGAGGQTLRLADQGATWSNGAAAGWRNKVGNVTIEDLAPDGDYLPTTFGGTRTNSAGQQISSAPTTVLAETRLVMRSGEGTFDPATDSASISWQGDATILFYSGMTYFHLSDPELTVSDGAGTITATLGGFATSQTDATVWEEVPEEIVTLADLEDVEVTDTGLITTPAYRGVTYTAPPGGVAQQRTGADWGSFPQDFVDFQEALGQGPYWYSSGGSADQRKVAKPVRVDFSPPADVNLSRTRLLPNGKQVVTVTGTGFGPDVAPGAQVVFGKVAEVWRPSAGAGDDARRSLPQARQLVTPEPDGTFSVQLPVDRTALDAGPAAGFTGTYGVYTYAAGETAEEAYETFTPVTFARAVPTITLSTPTTTYGAAARVGVTVRSDGGTDGTVGLRVGTTDLAPQPLTGGLATFDLGSLPVGAHNVTATFSGNDNSEPASLTRTLTVGKAATRTTVSAPSGTYGGRITATATVTGPDTTGSVTWYDGATPVGTSDVVGGRATIDLGRISAGTHTLRATYSGNGSVVGSTDATNLSIARATGVATLRVSRRPTPRKVGRAQVIVRTPVAGSATGRVSLTVRTASGKVVRKLSATLGRTGRATVRLPRLPRGSYRLTASYTGNGNVLPATRAMSLTVR